MHLLKNFRPFLKYCFVGATGTFIDLASLYLFVEFLKIPVLIATTFSFLLAVVNNFILNKTWTFKNKSKNYRKLFIKFLIVSLIGLLLTLLCMYIFVHALAIWYMLAKAITSIIVLTWNFLANKYWTFKIRPTNAIAAPLLPFDLTIIVPAYNEERRLGPTLESIQTYITSSQIKAETIVVDDGSSDKTGQVVEKLQAQIPNLSLIRYEKNQGKGFAVKSGIEKSKGEFILFTDADNSTPIEELDNLKKALTENDADIAIGSRYLPGSNIKRKQPFYRIFIGRAGNYLIRLFLIDKIKDTQCGFKLFKHQAAQEIFALQKVKRFGFDMEALLIAKHLDYKIIEVPVSWFNSTESRVRPVKDALKTLRDLAYIKLNLWSGRYNND